MDIPKKLEEKQTKMDIKFKMDIIKRQRQLTCQIMEETEHAWEKTQRQRNETEYLKTIIEQQQKDINRLTAENQEQCSFIQNVILQLEVNKDGDSQETMLLLQTRAEINQERDIQERSNDENMNEQDKLEVTKYNRTKSQESKEEHRELDHHIKQEQEKTEMMMGDSPQSLLQKIKLETKQTEEQIEKTKEFNKNREELLQQRILIKQLTNNMKAVVNNIKQSWTQMQTDFQRQNASDPEMESRVRQETENETLKMKLIRIREEMEINWSMLEESTQEHEVSEWREARNRYNHED